MVNLLNYDHRRVDRNVREFATALFPGNEYLFACIYRSADHPNERQVFVVDVAGQKFALKLDTKSGATGRLEREFATLQALHAHFQDDQSLDVGAPLYLSQDRTFFVTAYVDRRTATDAIYEQPLDNRARQVYRRAGHWLHGLHAFKEITEERLWPGWMFENLHKLTRPPHRFFSSGGAPQASSAEFNPMIARLERDAVKLDGMKDLKVFAHGDFHGRNLILGAGVTYGLHFTEVTEKLAVYDIVDFLKADVFRDAGRHEVDRSGITRANKEMFLRLYRHPINHDVLDFCMRARLLIDWLGISQGRYAKTNFQRKKFERLRGRLLFAFEHTL